MVRGRSLDAGRLLREDFLEINKEHGLSDFSSDGGRRSEPLEERTPLGVFTQAAGRVQALTPTSQRVHTRPQHDVRRLPWCGGISSVAKRCGGISSVDSA